MICIVCNKEIENPIEQYGIPIHSECTDKLILFENPTYKATTKCCKKEIYLRPTFINGWLKGVGKCEVCGKIHITYKFPPEPTAKSPKLPKSDKHLKS